MISPFNNGSILYQIYPQSFQDSNRDGIGDLQGIIQRLPYFSYLGIDTLWINPIFESPFQDAGYDVSDFYKIARRYGTSKDLKELCKKAKEKNIRIILDLVAGHTSIEHPWFIKELKEIRRGKRPQNSRYIWKSFDSNKPPPSSDELYVKNFFSFQPALNYGYRDKSEDWMDTPEDKGPKKNKNELKKILSYWFKCGVSGFRVDMASTLVKSDRDKKENTLLWKEIRNWIDNKFPGRILVAEWSNPIESIQAGFHLDFMMHFNAPGYPSLFFNGHGVLPPKENEECFFNSTGKGSFSPFYTEYKKQLELTHDKGCISIPSSNHDFQRLLCKPRTIEELRVAWVFLMTQAGVPTIFYGDEIGMEYDFGANPKEGSTLTGMVTPIPDQITAERAGSRTNMRWEPGALSGFSDADFDNFYIPGGDDRVNCNVRIQQEDKNSLLSFVKQLIQLRKNHPSLGLHPDYKRIDLNVEYPVIIKRQFDNEKALIVLNPSKKVVTANLPVQLTRCQALILKDVAISDKLLSAGPYSYGIFIIE